MAHGVSIPSGGRAVSRGPKPLLALRGDDYLVERLRAGDDAAFEVIYERHVPGVLSFCRHMLGSREEAEDAVQHAFTAAHQNLLRNEREIRLKPWLYAIARNRCLSMLRARREHADERIETTTEGLDSEVERRAELRQLVDDLLDLPEDQRAALVLSELRDLSHADVAEVLDCGVGNVKGLVFRARAGLSERREARETSCREIREDLAVAKGGMLRRGKLRHHLRYCAPCSAYLDDVRHQRKMMAAILPVAPTAGLKAGVLSAAGIGGGAAGAGGAAAGGGGLLAALAPAGGVTVAKVAIVGAVVAGGGGLVSQAAIDRGPPDRAPGAASEAPARTPEGSARPITGSTGEAGRSADAARPGAGKREEAKAKAKAKGRKERARQQRQKLKEKKLKLERTRPGFARPPTAGRGGRPGVGRPVRRRAGGDPPKPPPAQRPRRARPSPAVPRAPKPKEKPKVERMLEEQLPVPAAPIPAPED